METVLTKQDILELLKFQAIEFDRKLNKESDERSKEAEERREEAEEHRKKEADERRKEADERRKEAEENMKKFDRKIGELTGTLGRFVEGMIEPNILKMFKERGIIVRQVQNRVMIYKDNGEKEAEIDLLLINSEYSIAVEVKTTLNVDAVNEHLERLNRIQKNPPRGAKGTILLGAVTGLRIEEEADKYAYRKGFFVLKQKGEIVEIVNDTKFNPREWKIDS